MASDSRDGSEPQLKKHACPDCICCQWCSDDRCRLCRRECSVGRKLTQAEQIELFDLLNAEAK